MGCTNRFTLLDLPALPPERWKVFDGIQFTSDERASRALPNGMDGGADFIEEALRQRLKY